MTFEENPFRVLQVSIYADKATINERADELSFEDPDREEIFEQARMILLNPKKRIAAEIHWFLDNSHEEKYYKVEDKTSVLDIFFIDRKYSELDAEEILKQINFARVESKFPAVKDTAAIKSELKDIRYEIRGKIQDFLKEMTRDERIRFATDLADLLTVKNIGVIAEDFFECYRLEMTPFLEKTTEQIIKACKIKFEFKADFSQFFYLAEPAIKDFVEVIKPLDEMSLKIGTADFHETEKIFYAVRNVAIKLFNEKNLIDYPLRITQMLEENFSYLPPLAEKIRADIKFLIKEKKLLEEAKARLPTQAFLDAKAALDNIQATTDKNLHFEKGFEQANLDFYEKIFKPGLVFDLIRLANNTACKPAELKILKARGAEIYIVVGNAMTWAHRADLAVDCFKKALPYAEASGDAELISLTRKKVDEWQRINKITINSKDDSSDFFWIIVIGIIFFLLTR